MTDQKWDFYAGVRECGCMTALMVDDESTTAEEIAEFATEMAKLNRRVVHRSLTHAEFQETFKACTHQAPPNNQVERQP